MKPGSLVEYIGTQRINLFGKTPKNNVPYTIDEIDNSYNVPLITLVEYKLYFGNGEVGFDIRYFRELLPEIDNIEEFIEEHTIETEKA